MQARWTSRLVALALVACSYPVQAAEPAKLDITSPKTNQVLQRVGFAPGKAEPTGFADVELRFDTANVPKGALREYRVVKLAGATGSELGWSQLANRASVRIPAGGWYRLEVRCRDGDTITHAGAVEPIGVGEVFMVAGQSYATNCNDEQLKVSDPQKRVVAFDAAKGMWVVGNDPQPVPDGSEGGSIWPPVGDALVKEFQVPIAFANVAVGATSTAQWMPEGTLHNRLVETGKTLGRFRAVLWQQGESDVIAKTSTEKYVASMRTIRHAAATAWGRQPPWLLAKSTLHPTVYNDPVGEGNIRKAVDLLTARPGFQPGPDTDTLTGPHRGDNKSRRHFSALGQGKAAEMWVEVLKKNLAAPRTTEELLADMHLLEPVWSSPIIRRESSILMQLKPDDPVSARLAFPASEILEVATADGSHRFDLGSVALSTDGVRLNFAKPGPVEPILGRQLFVPKGSPQSYSARAGHPDESLMYHPGRWFHDRNVEITYRRSEEKVAIDVVGTLPRTIARLKAGEPFTFGVSGDSISTGADASAISKAAPNQPGFADLVVAQLQAQFDSQITLKNRAVGGWSVANGVTDLDKLLAEKPNLIVVAYGMNDVGRRDPKWFGEQTRTILDRIKAADKDIEVILVSSMLGHSEWTATPREMFPKYRDELKRLAGPGIALADVTAVWELLLKNKHDLDLTGNGLNHPNDFGHRLYAQTILSTLIEPAKPFPGKPTKWQGLPRHDFKVGDLDATVVVPEKPLPGRPWVWRGEFFGAFADADIALVKAGWHLAYVKTPDLFGSPRAIRQWEKFHAAMVKEHGLHPRPGFIGLSRGGLYCMNWAAAHPDKTLAVYLDNAVCDFKSWPGGQAKKLGTGKGAGDEWRKMLAAFDFKSDDEAIAYKLNPVDNLAPLAKAKIPLLLVYGDKDTVVPHTENSELVFDRYKSLGGPVERIVKPGQDHHPHGLTDVAPVVKFFANALDAKK